MKRAILATVAATVASLTLAPSAFAWQHTAACTATPLAGYVAAINATATWSEEFENGAGTRLEVVQLDRPVSPTSFVTVASIAGTENTPPPTRLTYRVPLTDRNGQPVLVNRYYLAKSTFVDENTEAKSKVCQVGPTQVDCKGNMYPPGVPVPPASELCAPPPVIPPTVTPPSVPPPVAPPAQVVPPSSPPVTSVPVSKPECVPVSIRSLHVVKVHGKAKLRGPKVKRVRVYVNGRLRGHSRTVRLPRRGRVVFKFDVNGCSSGTVEVIVVRRRATPPRFTG